MATPDDLVRDYQTGIDILGTPPRSPEPGANLAATLPVWALAGGAVTAFAMAADRWRVSCGLEPLGGTVDPVRVTAAFSSERLFLLDGARPQGFAELSGFFRAADAWVRTHANYPHHRARLLTAVGLPADAHREDFTRRVATLTAADIETRAHAHGAIAVRVRDEAEWADSPQGKAAAAGPLVALETRTDRATVESPTAATRLQPLRGLRVLDLTRVIAGPVATRALALLGADVLRIDPPQLPEIGWQFLDTCQGKRSTVVDLRTGLPVFRELISNADIIISGYRPGRLEHLGVRPAQLRPGIVQGRVRHGAKPDHGVIDAVSTASCRPHREFRSSKAHPIIHTANQVWARCPHRPSTTPAGTCSPPGCWTRCVPGARTDRAAMSESLLPARHPG